MKLRRALPLASLASALVSASVSGQPANYAYVESIPLGTASSAKAGSGEVKLSRGIVRAAPILMETRAHVHADGTVSTTCAAVKSSVPHSVAAAHPVGKLPQREQ